MFGALSLASDATHPMSKTAGEKAPPKRLLVVLELGRHMPSGVVRALIYRDRFKNAGFSARYVDHYKGLGLTLRGFNRLYRYFSEWWITRLARRADVVYMSKINSLPFIQRLRKATRARLVLDFGDALWVHDKSRERKFDQVLRLVDAVTTDGPQTAEYVRPVNPNCVVIPDCPQVERFDEMRSQVAKRRDGTIVIGWVGSFSTTYNLYVVWEALEKLFVRYDNLHLRLVGTNKSLLPPFEKIKFSVLPAYDQESMIREVLQMDIGLFPLQDVEASRVRGVLKAAVYMSGEAAVVCSPVGQCTDLIKDGENGMLAYSTEEWVSKLETLIRDEPLRRRIARAGLEKVRADFTIDKSFSLLRSVLSQT